MNLPENASMMAVVENNTASYLLTIRIRPSRTQTMVRTTEILLFSPIEVQTK